MPSGPAIFQPQIRVPRANKWAYATTFILIIVLIGWALVSARSAQEDQKIKIVSTPMTYAHNPKPWMKEPETEKPIELKPGPTPVEAVQTLAPTTVRPTPAPPRVRMQKQPPPKRTWNWQTLTGEETKSQTAKNTFVLGNEVQNLPSPYTVLAGNILPAALVTGINSDLPGQIKASVTETIYDSVTQTLPLIPQGTIILGAYDHGIIDGQNRILAVWNRLIFPDGKSLDLGQMDGTDTAGYAGFEYEVDNHLRGIFARALLLSIVSTGTSIAQNGTGGREFNDSYNSPGNVASAQLGQQLGRASNQILQKGFDRKPTITIPPGYLLNVSVKRDLVFTSAYPFS